jgi:hypothetical protein
VKDLDPASEVRSQSVRALLRAAIRGCYPLPSLLQTTAPRSADGLLEEVPGRATLPAAGRGPSATRRGAARRRPGRPAGDRRAGAAAGGFAVKKTDALKLLLIATLLAVVLALLVAILVVE